MNRTILRRALALVVVCGGAVAAASLALAAGATVLSPTVEAWYQPNPSCSLPVGCITTGALPIAVPAGIPTSAFPAGTMHAGVSGGVETARAYIGLPLKSLGGAVTSATLTVPLDTAPSSGSTTPERSKLQVCTTTAPLVRADGSIAAPPRVDCSKAAIVAYAATPQPHLEADLSSLAARLPSATGLALVPDATLLTPADAWRVVFSAHDRVDASATPPARVQVTVADAAAVPTVELPPAQGLPTARDVALPPVAAPLDIPVPAAAIAEPPPMPAASTDVLAVASLAAPETLTVGYAYPAIWLFPLVLLVGVPAAARALTKDLRVPTDDDGADP
jgi:hypothetical protein